MPTFYTTPYNPSNDLNATGNRARVAGSSFTVFTWQGSPISFAQQISHASPTPVAQTVPIHPLDSPYPIQLVTPQALTMGTITLSLYELYGANVWQRLAFLNGQGDPGSVPVDLAGIFQAVANSKPIHVYRVVRPPSLGGRRISNYTEEFHNVVVSALDDGETIQVGAMEVIKNMTLNYTHITRGGYNTLLTKSNLTGVAAPPGAA